VSGFSKYQTQESLSDFFALIPPKPEQVILFPNDQKGKTLEHPFAFAVYKSDEDT
jgi:predicted metal-dependent RNase